MTPLLLGIVYFGLIGVAAMVVLRTYPQSRTEWAATALLYGVGTTGLLGQLLGAVGVRLTPSLFGGLFVLAGIVVLARHVHIRVGRGERGTMTTRLAGVITMVPLAVLIVQTLASPLTDYDGRITWMLKARAIARERTITGPFFQGEGSRDPHSQYPLLIPIAAASILEVAGSDDDHVARPVYAFAMIGFLVVLGAALRSITTASVAAFIIAAIAWLPQVAIDGEGGMLSGYADIPLIAFVSLALLSVLRRQALTRPLNFSVQLAFIACTKNEGLVFAVILCLLAISGESSLTRATVARALAALSGLGIAMGLLARWRAQIPLEHDENYPQLLSNLADRLPLYPSAAAELLSRMLYYRSWGAFWIITAAATAVGLRSHKQRTLAAEMFAALACVVALYVTTYVITNWTIKDLAVSSANRLLMHLLPFAATLLAIGADAVNQNEKRNTSIRA